MKNKNTGVYNYVTQAMGKLNLCESSLAMREKKNLLLVHHEVFESFFFSLLFGIIWDVMLVKNNRWLSRKAIIWGRQNE